MIKGKTTLFFRIILILLLALSNCSQPDEELPVQRDEESTLPGILESEEELIINPKPYPPEIISPWFQNPGFVSWNSGNKFVHPGAWVFPGGPGWLVIDGKTVYGYPEMPFVSGFDPKDALWSMELPVYPQSPGIADYNSLFFVLKGYGVIALDSRSGEVSWQRVIPDVNPKTPSIQRGMLQISIDTIGFDLLSTSDGSSQLSEPVKVSGAHRFYGSDFLWVVSQEEDEIFPWWVHQQMPQGFQSGSGDLYSLNYRFNGDGKFDGVEVEPLLSNIIGGSPYPLGKGWLFFQKNNRYMKAISLVETGNEPEDENGNENEARGYKFQEEWEFNVADLDSSYFGVVYPQGSPVPGWPLLVLGNENELQIIHGGVGILLGMIEPVEFQRLIPFVHRGLVQLTSLLVSDWIDDRTFSVYWPTGFIGLRTPSTFFVPTHEPQVNRVVVYEKNVETPQFLFRDTVEHIKLGEKDLDFYVDRNQLPLEFWLTVEETGIYNFVSVRADRAPIRMIITLDGGTVYDNATHVRLESSAQLTLDENRRYRVKIDWAGGNESGDMQIAGISFSRSQ